VITPVADTSLPRNTSREALRSVFYREQGDPHFVDGTLLGLPLPEPFASRTPGLLVGLFPTSGRIPGGQNLVFPPKFVLRINLLTGDSQFADSAPLASGRGPGPRGSLGDLNDSRTVFEHRQHDQEAYFSLLDRIAPKVAGGTGRTSDNAALRSRASALVNILSERAIVAVLYRLAPVFTAWLNDQGSPGPSQVSPS